MRITLIGTLLLFSALARCQRASEKAVPACVTDCQKFLAEHGLLTDGMKSTCAAPKLQRAHFQCLINLCSPESYGRALAYSVSACCDTGANIIPLHPIDISQLPQHKRSLQSEVSGKTDAGDKYIAFNQKSDLAPNFAVALTCNTGQDGVITVSLGSPRASQAAASVAEGEDLFSANEIMTSVLSNGPATMSLHNAVFMDETRGLGSDSTTDCVSFDGGHRTTSWTTTTQKQSASCESNESRFASTPTSTACGSLGQLVSTTSQTYPSAPCTSSRASDLGDSRSTLQVTSSTRSSSQTLDLTPSCTSSLSQTDAGSSNWPSDNENVPTTDCSDDGGRRASSTRLQTSTHKSWTLDSNQWSTSRLSSSDIPCSSILARSTVSSSQSFTLASAISRNSITSTSCTASDRSSSSSFSHSSSTPCLASTEAGTSRSRSETARTSNTMSSTTSSKFTITSSSDGNFAATPAAYTFSSLSSLPPAYVPPLEEYGYGTPPPIYGFPSQRHGGDDPRASGASYSTTSPLGQSSSSESARHNGNPPAYGTSSAWLTRMAHAVPTHATNTDHDRSTLEDISNPVEITLISSVSGEGLQTTIITVNQAQATSLTMPLALATNSPVGGRFDFSTPEEGSQSNKQHSGSSDEFNNSGSVGFETPMPAMLVGGSVTTGPSIHVLISAVSLAAGFFICIL